MLAALLLIVPLLVVPPPTGAVEVDAPATTVSRPALPAAFTRAMLDDLDRLPAGLGPLPAVPIPESNPLSAEKIALGRRLFFDPRLSADRATSCASCHDPATGWTTPAFRGAAPHGVALERNAPSIVNAAYDDVHSWDGRIPSLEEQAKSYLLEQGVDEWDAAMEVERRVGAIPGYRDAFRAVFHSAPTIDAMARALAAFQRTIVTGPSRFDRYCAGDKTALTEDEKEGLILFVGRARCATCHRGPRFSDGAFHALGLGSSADPGRGAITGQVHDHGAFRTPTLRNVARTAPYMHDGSLARLEDVVDFYDAGGADPSNPVPLGLTETECDRLVAFLRALSSPLPLVRAPILPEDGDGTRVVSVPAE